MSGVRIGACQRHPISKISRANHTHFSVSIVPSFARAWFCVRRARARVFLVPFITVSSEDARPAAAHVRIVESPTNTPADVNSTLVNRRANKPELVRDACERRFVCSREFDCANPGQTSCCTSRASPHTRAAIGFLARSLINRSLRTTRFSEISQCLTFFRAGSHNFFLS